MRRAMVNQNKGLSRLVFNPISPVPPPIPLTNTISRNCVESTRNYSSNYSRACTEISSTIISKFAKQTRTNVLRSFGTSSSSQNASVIRQNYHEESEKHINKQINMELFASYVYMSMAYYFDRADVAFPGFHEFFKKASDEEREDATKLMKHQNLRGGRIVFQPISKPNLDEWASPLEAIKEALELEKSVNQALLDLHRVAEKNNDPELSELLESEFLDPQVKTIKKLGEHLTNLSRVGKGLGEVFYDKEIIESKD